MNLTVSPRTKGRHFIFKKLGGDAKAHTESENEVWEGQQSLARLPSSLLIL